MSVNLDKHHLLNLDKHINQYVDVDYQNPHAKSGLKLSLKLISNTPGEEIEKNIYENSRKYHDWLQVEDETNRPAVLIGGGASINDHIHEIKALQESGAAIFALNAASKWARKHGIYPDYQIIIDAKEETSSLVDPFCKIHLFASRCNPKTFGKVSSPMLFHLQMETLEAFIPAERVKDGGYVIVGGDTTVGTCGLCVAYTQGYRDLHVFGYDSSHKDGKSHAYKQLINNNMPTMEVEHGGKTYISSIAMSKQPASFMVYSRALKKAGCDIHVYGEGLLQAVYNTKYEDLTEQAKYELMWSFDEYREIAPGEILVDTFMHVAKPEGSVIDFGCGTGRAGLKLSGQGLNVTLVDFANNSRDIEATQLPFIQHDLTKPLNEKADYGFCTDVMEHIPTDDVPKVVDNIMASAGNVFFQISTVDDWGGAVINEPLHLTVKPHEWWEGIFISSGYTIEHDEEQDLASLFYVSNPDRRETCQ